MKKALLVLLLAASAQLAFSQSDSLIFANAFESKNGNDINAAIFNGREHIGYPPLTEGIPYYGSKDWQPGHVVFEGALYNDVFLKYDLVADRVIVRHPNKVTGIMLFTPRVQSFLLGNRQFVNLAGKESELKAGIYEELVKGKTSLYVKRTKLIEESIVMNELVRKVADKNIFYVFKDGHYYPVKKQKSIMDVVADKRNAVSSSLKASKIKFKSNPELAMTKIVELYNQLSH